MPVALRWHGIGRPRSPRVADSIEKLGPVEVQDLILHNEVTADGLWPSLTVYFQPAEPTLRSVP
jgi:hypothetical protein